MSPSGVYTHWIRDAVRGFREDYILLRCTVIEFDTADMDDNITPGPKVFVL